MTAVVYDAAVLIAADRNDRRAWAEHKERLERGVTLLVPAPVVAQVSRAPRQALLRRLLSGCEVVALDELAAHEVGRVLGVTSTTDVVDAAVAVVAAARGAVILTGDVGDISRLASAAGADVAVVGV